jgi:hypothetical protein
MPKIVLRPSWLWQKERQSYCAVSAQIDPALLRYWEKFSNGQQRQAKTGLCSKQLAQRTDPQPL